MKVVILAGGFGSRISEESHLKPKPMIEVGGFPLLWHIMKTYSHYGFNEFIICCGYKGFVIKEYFANYFLHHSNITFDFANNNEIQIHNNVAEPWKVTLIDTGYHTMTGGRIRRVREYLNGEPFLMTYGDGVTDANINDIIAFHNKHKRMATMLAVQPGGRFGVLDISDASQVLSFKEKTKESGGWVNAGYMVLEPEIFNLIEGDDTIFEKYPLEECAGRQELNAYRYDGFWMCMDTLRDKMLLEELYESGEAPWVKW